MVLVIIISEFDDSCEYIFPTAESIMNISSIRKFSLAIPN